MQPHAGAGQDRIGNAVAFARAAREVDEQMLVRPGGVWNPLAGDEKMDDFFRRAGLAMLEPHRQTRRAPGQRPERRGLSLKRCEKIGLPPPMPAPALQ